MRLLRELHAQVNRMRRMAREAPLQPERAAVLIQPFIDKYKSLRLAMSAGEPSPVTRHPEHARIRAAVLASGLLLQRQGLKGLAFHNGYMRALALVAKDFSYRGFTECGAAYLSAQNKKLKQYHDEEIWGRVDVAWASRRVAQVVFEIDSTVKAASLWKLQQAQVSHKYWVYFGSDVWRFKTFLKKHDPAGAVSGIVLPVTWKP